MNVSGILLFLVELYTTRTDIIRQYLLLNNIKTVTNNKIATPQKPKIKLYEYIRCTYFWTARYL